MNLRGAALDGGGVYTLEAFEDIAQMLQSPALKRYEKIALVGYSFGGSMMMNYLAHHPDPRVVIGVGVSAALNVTQSTAALDNKKSIAEKFIGGQLLKNMQAVYAASYKDHPGRYTSPPPEQTAKIKSLLEWNRAVVAKNIEQFNIEMSPEATIANIKVPTTLFQAANDPVVSEAATRQAVACGAPDVIHLVQEQSGGHVYMPNITTRVIDAVRVATE
jgi:predicted alpha/beta-fold hydrolase